jgi:D-alanine transaminase
MEITYFNGKFIPKEEVKISPDDRGFLFADGIYEVVHWYESFFYDMNSHVARLKRSLRELRINWDDADKFPSIAKELLKLNQLENKPAMVYLQITRGAARRSHSFPVPSVSPTSYAFAWQFIPDKNLSKESGIKVMMKEDIRWSRCDIKSVALLPNTISFQEAHENGLYECIFVRNGLITEGSHSNIFLVIDNTLFTHPESNYVLSGVTRKNVLRIARDIGIQIREEAVQENRIRLISEAFITNSSSEITPVVDLGGNVVGDGTPGPITRQLLEGFKSEIASLKSSLI